MQIVGEPDVPPDKKHVIDIRFELWNVDKGAKLDPKDPGLRKGLKGDFNWHKPFIAKYKDGWLIAQDPVRSIELQYTATKPKGDYQEVPEGWLNYAQEFVFDRED